MHSEYSSLWGCIHTLKRGEESYMFILLRTLDPDWKKPVELFNLKIESILV